MLLWCDLETTGLDPKEEIILEIGLILTDNQLEIVDVYSSLIHWGDSAAKIKAWAETPVQLMHEKNGIWELYDQQSSARNIDIISEEMIEFMEDNKIAYKEMDERPYLAGATVNFDRSFLQNSLSHFHDTQIHYRNVDVTTVKQLARMWHPDIVTTMPPERKIHRAIPDLEDSIAQLKWFREEFMS